MSHNTSNVIQFPTKPTNEAHDPGLGSHIKNKEHQQFRRIVIAEMAQLRWEIAEED
jgi:hypothetical protein